MQILHTRTWLAVLTASAVGVGAVILFGPPPDYRPDVEKTTSVTFWRKGTTCTATAEEVLAIREALLSAEVIGHEEYPGAVGEYLRLAHANGDATDVTVMYFGAAQGPAARYYLMGSVLQSTKLDALMVQLRERASAKSRSGGSR